MVRIRIQTEIGAFNPFGKWSLGCFGICRWAEEFKEEKQKIIFLEADKHMAIWSHQHQSGNTCWISGELNMAPGQGEKHQTVGCALRTCRSLLLLQDPRNWLSGWTMMLCFATVGLFAFAFGSASVIQRTSKWGSQVPGENWITQPYSTDHVLGSLQTLRKCLLSLF